ncbi:hypothetical protein PR202_ga24825 [Eleusine coracana subsp. coracana]|uniref:RING-type domain-containing protein n=1 Tax=Eleusine coracana subsp. coracana TaxID=191504 RepID=A0AAV5D9H9_ELECO|nr:hypothetical protein PR202_ga24825 [Eleusine coracana subsp. coracana]
MARFARLSTVRLDRSAPIPPLVWTTGLDNRGLYYVQDGDFSVDDNSGFGAVPASGVAIACLPETTAGEGEEAECASQQQHARGKADDECAVCLEGYKIGQALRTMPCSHEFHESCIFDWLRVSRMCPLCRFKLPAEPEEEDEEEEEAEHDDDDYHSSTC